MLEKTRIARAETERLELAQMRVFQKLQDYRVVPLTRRKYPTCRRELGRFVQS
jgi:hypothetical protein